MTLTIQQSSFNSSLIQICFFLHQTPNKLYHPYYEFVLTNLSKHKLVNEFRQLFKFVEKIPIEFPLLQQSFNTIFDCVFNKFSKENPTVTLDLFSKFFTYLSSLIQINLSYMKFILNSLSFLSFLKGFAPSSLIPDNTTYFIECFYTFNYFEYSFPFECLQFLLQLNLISLADIYQKFSGDDSKFIQLLSKYITDPFFAFYII
jgi:hypothetical protein